MRPKHLSHHLLAGRINSDSTQAKVKMNLRAPILDSDKQKETLPSFLHSILYFTWGKTAALSYKDNSIFPSGSAILFFDFYQQFSATNLLIVSLSKVSVMTTL